MWGSRMFRKTKRKTNSTLTNTGRRRRRRKQHQQNIVDDSDSSSIEVERKNYGTLTGSFIGTPHTTIERTTSMGWNDDIARQPSRIGLGNHFTTAAEKNSVHIVERALRQIVLCSTMFIAGTMFSHHANVAYHILELSVCAWGTCLLITLMNWAQNRKEAENYLQHEDEIMTIEPPRLERLGSRSGSRSAGGAIQRGGNKKRSRQVELLVDQPPTKPQSELAKTIVPPALEPPSIDIPNRQSQEIVQQAKSELRQHPHLKNLYVMMKGNERIFPNGIESEIDNDLFYGKMLLMFRTPEADDPSSSSAKSSYFYGKQRRFEFQWQIRLKKLPEGEVFLAAEVEEPIQMGMIQRAVVGAALKFTKKMNQGFSYYFSDTPDSNSYLSFPVVTSMDRFCISKASDTLPILGQEIKEDDEFLKQRKKGGMKILWSTEHVYTLGLWSAYVDWVDWQIQGFPGIRPFSITSCVGVQPIMLNIYTQSSSEATKEVLTSIELSNATKATLGTRAKTWIEQNTEVKDERQMQHLSSDVTDGIESSEEIGSIDDEDESLDIESNEEVSLDESDDDDNDDADDDKYESEDLVEEENALGIDTASSSYLLSGLALHLREGPSLGNFVASGGGYACLQSTPTASIIIEKNQPKKKKKGLAYSTLIRSGDLVRVKLVDVTIKSVKWLTIHRGWWLKWSINRPKRNGLFYICSENQQQGSLVALGCPFSLVSKRWSNYTVGACVESSAKYGGRMLGIYKTDMSGEDKDDNPIQHELDYPAEKIKDNRILALLLCAEAYNSDVLYSSPLQSPIRNPSESTVLVGGDLAIPTLKMSQGNELIQQKMYHVDVPIWLEMMNRTTRSKQVVYAVRIKETVSTAQSGIDEQESGASSLNTSTRCFVKLRTIQELAPLLRLGVECKPEMSPTSDQWQHHFDFQAESESDNDADSFSSSSSDESCDSEEEMDDEEDNESHFLIAGPSHDQVVMTSGKEEAYPVVEEEGGAERYSYIDDSEKSIVRSTSGRVSANVRRSSSKLRREESADSESPETLAISNDSKSELVEQQVCPQFEMKKKSKHAAVIGRVASTVKNSTVITGKHVKNIGTLSVKGTVSATRAAGRVIPVSSAALYKQPRKHEPGGRGRVHRKSSDRRQIKMIGRALKKSGNSLSSIHSGQLLASDKVCRQISTILSDVSDNGISLLVSTNTQLESAFLRGNSAEIGVKTLANIDQKVDTEYIVARCIYDGKWREEYCILYTNDQHIAFYPPLGKKPCLAISFDEILSARLCEEEDTVSCPLPGLFVLAIDTAYKCHYLVFLEVQQREKFLQKLNDALFHMGNESHSRKKTKEFESFRMSLETSLTGSVGKWRAVTTGSKGKDKKKQRRILNGRKMSFDTVPIYSKGGARENSQKKIALYVENLLRMALSFSPDTFERAADSQFIEFLDECSRLRTMSLHDIDFTSKEAFCIFVNLYHCLLQHSLLLAVDGLPTKRSVAHFKRCSCYEIGDSVFSLSELECCVIRGRTSQPSHIKSPFVNVPKKSRSYRQVYGLDATDFRINFILNNGDKSYPSKVPILTPQTMDDKIDVSAFLFLMGSVKIDSEKRTVFLPKVCDVYRDDFGDGLVCLSRCLIYLDTKSQLAIGGLLEGGMVSVKFSRASNSFHSNLVLMDELSVSGV